MKKIFLVFLTLSAVLLPALFQTGQRTALADPKQPIQGGICEASGQTQCKPGDAALNINGTITAVLDLLSAAAGIVAVVMVLLAGFRYISSGGDTNKVASAKNALLYAVIGLVIVALSQVIVKFVLHHATATPKDTGYSHLIYSANSPASRLP